MPSGFIQTKRIGVNDFILVNLRLFWFVSCWISLLTSRRREWNWQQNTRVQPCLLTGVLLFQDSSLDSNWKGLRKGAQESQISSQNGCPLSLPCPELITHIGWLLEANQSPRSSLRRCFLQENACELEGYFCKPQSSCKQGNKCPTFLNIWEDEEDYKSVPTATVTAFYTSL